MLRARQTFCGTLTSWTRWFSPWQTRPCSSCPALSSPPHSSPFCAVHMCEPSHVRQFWDKGVSVLAYVCEHTPAYTWNIYTYVCIYRHKKYAMQKPQMHVYIYIHTHTRRYIHTILTSGQCIHMNTHTKHMCRYATCQADVSLTSVLEMSVATVSSSFSSLPISCAHVCVCVSHGVCVRRHVYSITFLGSNTAILLRVYVCIYVCKGEGIDHKTNDHTSIRILYLM